MTEHRWSGLAIGPFVFGRSRSVDTTPRRPRFYVGWIVVALVAAANLPVGILLALGQGAVHAIYLIAEAVADTDDTEAPR